MQPILADFLVGLLCFGVLVGYVQFQKRRNLTPRQRYRKALLAWQENRGESRDYTIREALNLVLEVYLVGLPFVMLLWSIFHLLARVL